MDLKMNLERTDFFAVLSLPIYEHGLALHLFRFSVISFNNDMMFPVMRSCICFVRSIPR